ncbi:MAG: 16S rRNA (cytosine(1402)-N(4))-methyltransferase RsmH [Eubacterium sp.]|nr:16S rRNA (cytosine(1402)-N(4))-methyltransferase RsmH [Eubacterium sp.]
MEFKHVSVLLDETIENLDIKPDGIYVDGTLGGAGHAREVCKRLGENGRFIGIDQDEEAIAVSTKRLEEFGEKVTIVKNNYVHMKQVLQAQGIDKVDGIVLDLGVSSYQLDNAERGFSYMEDAPLDMRMDREQPITAKDIVNRYPEAELVRIIKDYGEERYARNIARNILREREKKEIETTGQLVDIIRSSMPAKARNGKGHPAKRTFQAIRIECNQELEVLREALDDMIELLNEGGRLCIITFHSLEDRMVKNSFRKAEQPCTCPPNFPVCVCGKKSKGKVVTRKPILPSEEEIKENSRSKSAKLRVFKKVGSEKR